MRLRLLILLLATLLLVIPGSALAAEDGTETTAPPTNSPAPAATSIATNGTVTGTVKNGTAGGGSVSGLTVTLLRFQGTNVAQELTTTTADDGSFSFSDLPVASGEAYLARTSFQNVEYTSDVILLSNNPNSQTEITVYEPTADSSVVSIASRGVVIAGADAESGVVNVIEVLAIDVAGDRTYVGSDNSVLRLPVPPTVRQVAPQPGFNFGDPRFEDTNVLVSTGAIPPGAHNTMLSYILPYQGSELTLNVSNAMPTKSFHALVKEGTYTISSPSLKDDGTVDLGGENFRVLSIDQPAIGDSITIEVSGLPVPSSGGMDGTLLYVAIASGVALAAAGGLIFRMMRQRRENPPQPAPAGPAVAAPAPEPASASSLDDERLGLAAALNQLDDRHAAGTIEDETYEAERSKILEQLRAISRRMHGLEDAEA